MLELLVIHWNVDPEIFHIGAFSIRWYSLLFVSGFIFGWFMFRSWFRNEGIDEKLLDPLLYAILIATVVGARLGHCLFYQPDYYLASWSGFWEIFMPWKGGLSSHGGAIGMLLAVWWYVHKYGKKFDFDYVWVLDRLCMVVAFGGACIRLGNLFNSEIYGNVTTLPWGFIFEQRGETEPKHPTQIYESLTYLTLGIILTILYWKKLDKLFRGTFIGIFLVGCFGMRMIIEIIKEPQVAFEESMILNMGQLLSIPFVLLGIGFLVYAFTRKVPARAVHLVKGPKPKPQTHYAKPLNR